MEELGMSTMTENPTYNLTATSKDEMLQNPGGGGGNLGVILVRVCEPVFQNLPHSYTWPSEKTDPFIYLIFQNVDLFIYCLLIFRTHFCWLIHKYHSRFMYYQEDKQPRKISERKICAYTRMSEKWGLSHRNPEKSGHSCTFAEKRGPIIYLAAPKKGAIQHAHPYYAIYRKLQPPPPPPPPETKPPFGYANIRNFPPRGRY